MVMEQLPIVQGAAQTHNVFLSRDITLDTIAFLILHELQESLWYGDKLKYLFLDYYVQLWSFSWSKMHSNWNKCRGGYQDEQGNGKPILWEKTKRF